MRREIEDTLSFLKSRGVSEFVHFTSVDNLPGILQNGLLPRAELERREIAFQHNDSLRLDGKAPCQSFDLQPQYQDVLPSA